MNKMVCPIDCPNRCASPNCHNAETCENWAKHEAEMQRYARQGRSSKSWARTSKPSARRTARSITRTTTRITGGNGNDIDDHRRTHRIVLADALLREIGRAKMVREELKPCPFCGSTKLKTDSKSKFVGTNGLGCPVDYVTFSVRCNVCHARGSAFGGRVLRTSHYIYRENRVAPLPPWAKTEEELKAEAIEAWNRRVSE